MSSRPRKRRFINQTRTSESDPPGQTLEDDFLKATSSFIRLLKNREGRMEKITDELHSIAEEVEEIQTEWYTGITCGVIAIIFGAAASPFSGWVTVAIAAGGATAIANAYKNNKQGVKENLKRVEALRREFLLNMEPLEERLEEVKASAQKLEVLAGSSPSQSKVFKKIRSQASKMLAMMAAVMLLLRDTEFQKTKEPLDKTIVQEAAQLDIVMAELENMKQELQVFINTPIKTAVRLYIERQASGGGALKRGPKPRYSAHYFPALAGGSQRLISAGGSSMAYSSVAYNSRPMISSQNVAGLIK